MHPLEEALGAVGMTQSQLSVSIAALEMSRPNGKPLRMTQSCISEVCAWKRRITRDQAEACAEVLARCGSSVTAADLVFAKKPSRKRSAA